MGHSEHDPQGFYSLLRLHAINLAKSLSVSSTSLFALSLWPPNGIFWGTQFHSIYSGRDSLHVFLNTSYVFSIFSYVLNEALSLLGSLYLCTIVSFKGGSSLKISPFLFFHQKFQKSGFLRQLRKKHNETHCIWNNNSKHTKFT